MADGELDRFELLREVARGGMGTVHQARERSTGRIVAVKIANQTDDVTYARFQREARVLAELHHPAIVELVGYGRTTAARPFLAMEWIDGEDLRQRLARAALSLDEALTLVRRVAEGLAAAHARGIIHRDVKPGNVLLPERALGGAKLGDFGIARVSDTTHFTATGGIVGTPAYMSPEQCRGQDVGPRADVFSLGCLLYECLTGSQAFPGASFHAILARILFGDAPRLAESLLSVPPLLERLVGEMMHKDPAQRPADAGAVLARLAEIDLGDARRAAPAPGLTRSERQLVSVILAVPARTASLHELLRAASAPAPFAAATENVALGDLLRAAAARFGASAVSLQDGSVVAVVKGTGAATDLCARAARLALLIQEELGDVPIVVGTGYALSHETLPLGQVIDRAAARIGALDGIRVDEVTAGLIAGRFDLDGDRLLGEHRGERPRRVLGRVMPFVGRETELDVLAATFEECVADSVTRAVLVTAPAGVGKTRLALELLARLRAARPDLEVWIGPGDAVSAASPFGVLGRALRAAVGMVDGEPLEVRRGKLRDRVAAALPPGPDRERVTLFLGELLGAPFDAEGNVPLLAARRDPVVLGDQMRRAWLDFVAGECRARPVVIVLEDLQWGDGPSVRYVDAALRELAHRPLFVLALARPTLHEAMPAALWPMNVELRLDNLKRRASEELARQVLGGGVSSDTVERLVKLSSGNAFYLEELIRHVAHGAHGELPGTVLAMAQARLLELPDDARLVLRAASLFGQVFWAEALATLARPDDLRACLALLVDEAVLVKHRQARLTGTSEYAFRHALLQEAASAMLTDADRGLGHRLIAEWLVEAGESDAQVVAAHFERGDQPGRAVVWHQRAAEQALSGDDLEAAIGQAQRGIDCGAAGEVLGQLLVIQATAHQWQGRRQFGVGRAAAERALAELLPGSADWFHAARELIVLAGRLGDSPALAELAARVAASDPEPAARPAMLAALARAQWMLAIAGIDNPEAVVARAQALAGEIGDEHAVELGLFFDARAIRAACAGRVEEQLAEHAVAAGHFARAGARRNACWTDVNIGWARLEIGQLVEGERILRACETQAERMGLDMTVADCRQNLGLSLTRQGRHAEAIAVLAQAVAAYEKNQASRGEAVARVYASLAHTALGDHAAARAEAERALALSAGMPAVAAQSEGVLAHALLAAGDAPAALAAGERAMAVVTTSAGLPEGEPLIRLVHAEALLAAGRRAEGLAALGVARARLEERAATIADPELRRGFLANVPEVARTFELDG